MLFNVERQALRSALEKIRTAVRPVSNVDISTLTLFNITPERSQLTGYNLETGVTADVDVSSLESGLFLVSTDKLCAITAKMTGENIECDYDFSSETLNIKCGRSKVKIPALSAISYPALPLIDRDRSFEINGGTLAEMINRSVFAVSKSDSKPILQGELFDISEGNFSLAAIDGFRLAVRSEKVNTDGEYNFVVPGSVLNAVSKLIKSGDSDTVTVIPSKKHVIFHCGDIQIFTRLLEGDFHNYKATLPTTAKSEAVVPVSPLAEALERFMILVDVRHKAPLKCVFGNGLLSMSLKTELGEMSEDIDVDHSGETVTIGFNPLYLTEAVKAVGTDKIKFCLNGALSPMKIVPETGEAFAYLVLPVRMKG